MNCLANTEWSEFLHNNKGSALVILAVWLLVAVSAAGLAIDGGRAYLVHARLQHAIDAATLAGGRSMELDGGSDHRAQILKYFHANLGANLAGASIAEPEVVVRSSGRVIEVSASASVPSLAMGILGAPKVQVSARSVVHRQVQGMEIALVLDNSGSMNNVKIDELKEAAEALVEALYGDEEQIQDLYVSVVPFTARANLKGQDKILEESDLTGWHSPPVDSHVCFNLRHGEAQINDLPPGASPTWQSRFRSYTHWDDANPEEGWKEREVYRQKICPEAPILPLASDKSDILDAINAMNPDEGCTRYDVGTAWGWRTVSPKWRGLWSGTEADQPVDYDAPRMRKIVVVMTDGVNSPGPEFCAYDNDTRAESEAAFLETCRGMKDQGIIVYTITFRLWEETTNQLFADCASGTKRNFNSPDGDSLKDVFTNIAGDLVGLRLAN